MREREIAPTKQWVVEKRVACGQLRQSAGKASVAKHFAVSPARETAAPGLESKLHSIFESITYHIMFRA
jgi:hypothetical protein